MFLCETAELIGGLRVFRIYTAYSPEPARITLQNTGKIAVVPAVMNDLDKNRSIDSIRLHEFEQRFDGRVFRRRMRARGEGKGGIMFPDVYMRVDQERSFVNTGRG
jgi:hypothetical protein